MAICKKVQLRYSSTLIIIFDIYFIKILFQGSLSFSVGGKVGKNQRYVLDSDCN